MDHGQLKANAVVKGPIFPEPVQVIVAVAMGASVKLSGEDRRSAARRDKANAGVSELIK